MSTLVSRDLAYWAGDTEMRGYFCAPEGTDPRPAVVVVHGAHGLTDHIIACAEKIAGAGFAVLAADLWGGRAQLGHPDEIGPMLGRMLAERGLWMARLQAACDTLAAQTEVQSDQIAMVGYCFGGASALEFLRTGGEIRAAISLHGGLDMVGEGWTPATPDAQALICTGAIDPMAKPEDLARIEAGMSDAGVIWDTHIYGGVKHAFSEPDTPGRPPFAAYDARADRRSFAAMVQVLTETLTDDTKD